MVSKNTINPIFSPLHIHRLKYTPPLPSILKDIDKLECYFNSVSSKQAEKPLQELFPFTCNQPIIHFKKTTVVNSKAKTLRIGVILSGGQAPGGHNVIAGLYDALQKFNPKNQLIGFCDGPSGIIKNKTKKIDAALIDSFRNTGGFDMIGSGRTKIEAQEDFVAAENTAKTLDLDAIVIIGGDDSNTNAAVLAEYFKKRNVKTQVIGVPKTIDGDLRNEFIEISFGFDTATKVYSEIIGNILKDALSANKYYYFIKLMGRSASHIALECALQTHVNMTLISEEVIEKELSLDEIVSQIADMICRRAEKDKNFGAILIPEGIIEFIPEFNMLIKELNVLLVPEKPHASQLERLEKIESKIDYLNHYLSADAFHCLKSLPEDIQQQLFMDRDPHGNIQVSKIETERLLIKGVEKELKKRAKERRYKGKFSPQAMFCGYEGRSGFPTNFDCQYCYALGHVAALLIYSGATGYISCVGDLTKPVEEWSVVGLPIFDMLHLEHRGDKMKPVIKKALVDLKGKAFKLFASNRDSWIVDDDYRCPGPIQFEGPSEITELRPMIL